MGPAAAEFMRLLISRTLQHGGNAVATWSPRTSQCGAIPLQRKARQGTLDRAHRRGGIRSHGGWTIAGCPRGSIYEERGLLMF